jgi:FkbM family methyltransferase
MLIRSAVKKLHCIRADSFRALLLRQTAGAAHQRKNGLLRRYHDCRSHGSQTMRMTIPTMDSLSLAATDVMASVPAGLTDGKIKTGLYGLGFLGKWALPQLRRAGVRIGACYDANQALNGTVFESAPVYSPQQLKLAAPEFVLIAARHAVAPVSGMLTSLGIAHASYDAWHVATNFQAFRRVHDQILGDDRSKEVLRAVLMAMLSGQKRYCAAVYEKDQYFGLPDFCGAELETFVDAGAFAGDSLERFIWAQNGTFAKIYAFEPGARQFAALRTRVERLTKEWAFESDSIELINAGLGETESSVSAVSNGGQITNLTLRDNPGAAGEKIKVVSLDHFLQGRRVSLLKADVEGMEMALLKGARETIGRHKPKLAISVYHYPNDIPDIANYLAALVPDYRFALRHHSPQLMETVLYCWLD